MLLLASASLPLQLSFSLRVLLAYYPNFFPFLSGESYILDISRPIRGFLLSRVPAVGVLASIVFPIGTSVSPPLMLKPELTLGLLYY